MKKTTKKYRVSGEALQGIILILGVILIGAGLFMTIGAAGSIELERETTATWWILVSGIVELLAGVGCIKFVEWVNTPTKKNK